nr:MAG TPA: transposase-like protein [Caudoviricetes sp.]
MTERTCVACAHYNGHVCMVDGFIMGSYDTACDYYRAKRADGGKADIGIRCPNCGEQIDFHAGHINNGEVFIYEKGKPLMREVRYHCRRCDSTVIFLKKCEPKGVGHD